MVLIYDDLILLHISFILRLLVLCLSQSHRECFVNVIVNRNFKGKLNRMVLLSDFSVQHIDYTRCFCTQEELIAV